MTSAHPAELVISVAYCYLRLAGKSPEEFAVAAELRLHRIRSQLNTLFSKTACHRQSKLVALIGRVRPLKRRQKTLPGNRHENSQLMG